VVVNLCRHIFKFGQKSTLQQFASAMSDAKLQAFRSDLDQWANSVKEEILMHENQENSGFRALSRKIFKTATHQHKIATNLRMLDFCSTYNYQTLWKQTRKAGNASFFMQLAEYQTWRDSSDSCSLVCSGKLGSGKSVLLANIVDDLNLSAEKERCVVTYFFCSRDVPESLEARTIIGSLARQMLCTLPDLVEVSESYDVIHSTRNLEDVLELLIRGFPPSYKAYVVLDGLDECDNAERETLLEGLQKIQTTSKVLICASFRKEPTNDLRSLTEGLVVSRVLTMPDNNPDIDSFIEADLKRCLRQKRLVIGDATLILEIQDALLKGSQGMFLWVALQIQSLCSMKTDQAIREALANLPKDLSKTFQRILHKSGSEDQPLQEKLLRLVLAAHRPLTTDELREALSVTPGDATWDPAKTLNEVQSALACCGCLLVIDEEESTVRFVHHSFRQFILNVSNGASNLHFTFEDAQNTMANIVVTFLGYGVFGTELSKTKIQPIVAQSTPSKVVLATMGPSSTTRHLAMKLLNSRRQPAFDMSKVIAEARGTSTSKPGNAFKFYVYAKSHWQDHILYVSGQDAAILRLSTRLIQVRMSELRAKGKDFWTHCHWATENGNRVVLELLLKTGNIDTNEKVDDEQTPMMWAARNGHKDVVELLLGTGKVDVEAKDSSGWTPLMSAAQNGYEDVVELLLGTGKVDVDAVDSGGWTPLMRAAERGHKDVVKLLLGTGKVDVDAKYSGGWTPLMMAARNGQKDVVKLLLGAVKIDVDAKDSGGWTPLMWAAERGHKDVITLLLGTGKVDVDTKDSDGWTLLMSAARNGQKDVVELLLGTGKVDVDAKDGGGWTPLMTAARNGRKDVVKLLLGTGKVDVDAKDIGGWTPLMWAAERGQKDVVKLLLGTGKVDVDAKDSGGWTPLMWAVENGHKDIVELLLGTGKVDVDAIDSGGWTPLMRAADRGHKDVVKLLLGTGKVDVDAMDSGGWMPLMRAAERGHKDVVKLLLGTGKVDVDAMDSGGWTPLMRAAERGHKDVVKLLEMYI